MGTTEWLLLFLRKIILLTRIQMVFYQILKNGGACPHQNGWLWFEVCLVLSSGHWRSDLAKVSDEAGKTQIPLDFFSPWESRFLTFSAVLEYHCLWQHECVLLYWESPPSHYSKAHSHLLLPAP